MRVSYVDCNFCEECIHCGRSKVPQYTHECDRCGASLLDDVTLYYFEDEELCAECILDQYEVVRDDD